MKNVNLLFLTFALVVTFVSANYAYATPPTLPPQPITQAKAEEYLNETGKLVTDIDALFAQIKEEGKVIPYEWIKLRELRYVKDSYASIREQILSGNLNALSERIEASKWSAIGLSVSLNDVLKNRVGPNGAVISVRIEGQKEIENALPEPPLRYRLWWQTTNLIVRYWQVAIIIASIIFVFLVGLLFRLLRLRVQAHVVVKLLLAGVVSLFAPIVPYHNFVPYLMIDEYKIKTGLYVLTRLISDTANMSGFILYRWGIQISLIVASFILTYLAITLLWGIVKRVKSRQTNIART